MGINWGAIFSLSSYLAFLFSLGDSQIIISSPNCFSNISCLLYLFRYLIGPPIQKLHTKSNISPLNPSVLRHHYPTSYSEEVILKSSSSKHCISDVFFLLISLRFLPFFLFPSLLSKSEPSTFPIRNAVTSLLLLRSYGPLNLPPLCYFMILPEVKSGQAIFI